MSEQKSKGSYRSYCLPEEIEDELRAKNLLNFVLREKSYYKEIFVVIYENEKYQAFYKGWGSVTGVHLNARFDRFPLTDETGRWKLTCPLSEVKPITGYRWSDEWAVIVENGITDENGYQYARNWNFLRNKHKPSATEKSFPPPFVRRKRWQRRMGIDSEPPSKSMPYQLILKIKRATLPPKANTSHSYVETYIEDELYDTTISSYPDWNKVVIKPLLKLNAFQMISFYVFSSSSSSKLVSNTHDFFCGFAEIALGELLLNINSGSYDKTFVLQYPTSNRFRRRREKDLGSITIGLELKETKLFSIVQCQSNLYSELSSLTEQLLSTKLKQKIFNVDHFSKGLVHVIADILTYSQDILSEHDVYDIIEDVNLLVNYRPKSSLSAVLMTNLSGDQDTDANNGNDRLRRALIYPHGKHYFSKLLYLVEHLIEDDATNHDIIRNSSDDERQLDHFSSSSKKKDVTTTSLHIRAMHEHQLEQNNCLKSLLQPVCSSVYDLTVESHLTNDVLTDSNFPLPIFERAQIPKTVPKTPFPSILRTASIDSNTGEQMNSTFTILIYAVDKERIFEVRWTSYYDYVLILKEFSKIKKNLMSSNLTTNEDSKANTETFYSSKAKLRLLHSVSDTTTKRNNTTDQVFGKSFSFFPSRSSTADSFNNRSAQSLQNADVLLTAAGNKSKISFEANDSKSKSRTSESASAWIDVQVIIDGSSESITFKDDTLLSSESSNNDKRKSGRFRSTSAAPSVNAMCNSNSIAKLTGSLEISLSYDEVESIEIRNSYHMHYKYVLELKTVYAQSAHLKTAYANCYIEIDTVDGQHFQTRIDPNRRAVIIPDKPTTIAFDDPSCFILIPDNLINDGSLAETADNFVFATFHSDGCTTTSSSFSKGAASNRRFFKLNSKKANNSSEKTESVNETDSSNSNRRLIDIAPSKTSLETISNVSESSEESELSINEVKHPTASKKNRLGSIFGLKKSTSEAFGGAEETFSRTASTSGLISPKIQSLQNSSQMTTPTATAQRNSAVCSTLPLKLSKLRNNDLYSENEKLQLTFPRNFIPFELILKVIGVDNPPSHVEVDLATGGGTAGTGASDDRPYFVVYLGDNDGNVIPIRHSNGASKTGKSEYIYRSKVLPKRSQELLWNEDIVISTAKHPDELSIAKYLIVELWDHNNLKFHKCLGEVYIPIFSAETGNGVHTLFNTVTKYAIQPCKGMKSKYLRRAGGERVPLGFLNATLIRSEIRDLFSYFLQFERDRIAVKFLCGLRPIQTMDFAWPCRILSSSKNGLEDDVYHIFLGHSGVHMKSVDEPHRYSERTKMLKELSASAKDRRNQFSIVGSKATSKKNQSTSSVGEVTVDVTDQVFDLLLPYSSVSSEDVLVLSENMLFLTTTIKRLVKVSGAMASGIDSIPGPDGNRFIEREICLDIVVGPCLADEMYTILLCRIQVDAVRSSLMNVLSRRNVIEHSEEDVDQASKPISVHELDNVAKSIQYETFCVKKAMQNTSGSMTDMNTLLLGDLMNSSGLNEFILSDAIQKKKSKLLLPKESQSTLGNHPNQNGDFDEADDGYLQRDNYYAADDSHKPYEKVTAASWRCKMTPLRLLMFKMAYLQAYNWYVMEVSPFLIKKEEMGEVREFTDEYITHLTDNATNVLFNEVIDVRSALIGNQTNADSLVVRLQEIMQLLSKDVRSLLLRRYVKKSSTYHQPVETARRLTRLVYDQYLAIVQHLTDILTSDVENEPAIYPVDQEEDLEDDADEDSDDTEERDESHNNADRKKPRKYVKPRPSTIPCGVVGPHKKGINHINPQKKRDLICFLIIHDDLFETYLNAHLICENFRFTSSPMLSRCIDFDVLVQKFSTLLNENILMWNTKTLQHFLSHKENSGENTFAPWDIGKLIVNDKLASSSSNSLGIAAVGRELFISDIPETIQQQLNVQIGLKKLSPNVDHLSIQSLQRVVTINEYISAAIAKAYVGLAAEYEKILHLKLRDYQTMTTHLKAGIPSNPSKGNEKHTNEARAVKEVTVQSEIAKLEYNFMCVIISILNDCNRILTKHIPESMASFLDEEIEKKINSYFEDIQRKNKSRKSLAVKNLHGNDVPITAGVGGGGGGGGGDYYLDLEETMRVLFFNSIKAFESVSQTALNILSNVTLFNDELRSFFLSGFEQRMLDNLEHERTGSTVMSVNYWRRTRKQPAAYTRRSNLSQSSSIYKKFEKDEEKQMPADGTMESNASQDNSDSTGSKSKGNELHSPTAIICATLTEFFNFATGHMYDSDLQQLLDSCMKKITLRYLIFLRDSYLKLESIGRKSDGTRGSFIWNTPKSTVDRSSEPSNTGPLNDVLSTEEGEFIRKDLIIIVNCFSTILNKINSNSQLVATTTNGNNKKSDRSKCFGNRHTMFEVDEDDSESDGGDQSDQQPSNAGPFADAAHSFDFSNTMSLIHFLSETIMEVYSGEVSDSEMMEGIIQKQFLMKPPNYNADGQEYDKILEKFLGFKSFFHNPHEARGSILHKGIDPTPRSTFTVEVSPSNSLKVYSIITNSTLQFSDFACVNLIRSRFVTVRVWLNGTMHETSIRLGSRPYPNLQWDEKFVFKNVPSLENQFAIFQINGIRPYGFKRYKTFGAIIMNLSELNIFKPSNPKVIEASNRRTRKSATSIPFVSESSDAVKDSFQEVDGTCGWYIVEKFKSFRLPPLHGNNSSESFDTSQIMQRINQNLSNMDTLHSKGTSNSFIAVLSSSSDQPRDDVIAPQLRIRIKIIEKTPLP